MPQVNPGSLIGVVDVVSVAVGAVAVVALLEGFLLACGSTQSSENFGGVI